MKVTVNARATEIPEQTTISGLKDILRQPHGGVAVAVNGKIVTASDHDSFILHNGDDIVLIGAAYGG